jgi:hypothetical protein
MLNNPKSEALRRVRYLIKTGKMTFICHALDDVAMVSNSLRHACGQLKCYVQESLAPYDNLQDWQHKNWWGDRDADQRRADRLAWIDWMLEGSPNAAD